MQLDITQLITLGVSSAATLLGVWLGYYLAVRQAENQFRRTVLRDIAFEYRRLASSSESGVVQGLIRAGICQCQKDREYSYVVNLIVKDD